jgi:hypothetical protein
MAGEMGRARTDFGEINDTESELPETFPSVDIGFRRSCGPSSSKLATCSSDHEHRYEINLESQQGKEVRRNAKDLPTRFW